MNKETEIIKVRYCQFDCPFKKDKSKLTEIINDLILDIKEETDDCVGLLIDNSFEYFIDEFQEEICEQDICPLNSFLRELENKNII